jgi:hypothetical protein
MAENAVQELDRAALALLQALAAHGDALKPYLEANHLEALSQEVVALRRALLGLEMGQLYWDAPADVVDDLAHSTTMPVTEAAARAAARLNPKS